MPEEVDLSRISPEEFAQLVHGATDEQILEAIRDVGVGPTLDRIFEGMRERFRPDRARGEDAVIQFVVTDQGDEHPYMVTIREGSCRVERGRAPEPRGHPDKRPADVRKAHRGQGGRSRALPPGELRISGDLMFARGS
jgi:hypothetical protein